MIQKKNAIPFKCILLVTVFLLTFFIPYLLFCFKLGDFSNTADLLYAELLTLIVYGTIILLVPRWGIMFSFVMQSLICAVLCFYIYYYDSLPGESMFYILLETNKQEARGYIFDYIFSLPVFVFLGLWVLLCWQFHRLTKAIAKSHLRFFIPFLVLPLLIPLFHNKTRQDILRSNFVVTSIVSYHNYNRLQRETSEALKLPLRQLDEVKVDSLRPQKEIHVLVIGESADRDHMGVYGYHRQTTPLLNSISKDLYCFSNVICSFLNTIPNMNALLTFENTEIYGESAPKGTMIHYLKKAGYKTYWISNQSPIGMYETLTTIMARNCEEVFFVNFSERLERISYDQKLHEPFQKILSENVDKKYIFVHLMGQHNPYRLRYPPQFNQFKEPIAGKNKHQSIIINHYDNATLYNDFVINEMIEQLQNMRTYSTLIYLSDHGLEVCESSDFHGHSFNGGLELPFIVWLSKEFHHFHPNIDKQFRQFIE